MLPDICYDYIHTVLFLVVGHIVLSDNMHVVMNE